MVIERSHSKYYHSYEQKAAEALDVANALAICKELYAIGKMTKEEYEMTLYNLLCDTSYEIYDKR